MNTAKEDLLLHPVRMRIILAMAGRQMTARQLAAELKDIPQASLYRNINALAAAGILSVVQERRVHNTMEKTYALPGEGLILTMTDLESAQSDDYLRLFTQYLGLLMGYYARYIGQGDVDFARDNVGFQMLPAYLSEGEFRTLGQALNAAVLPYLKNEPAPDRRRYIFGVMSIPDVAGEAESDDSQASAPEAESPDR